jgi:hypothetical protein
MKAPRDRQEWTRRAIKAAGGATKLEARFKISHQAIYKWVREGVPSEWVIPLELEQVRDSKRVVVARWRLRPDIYPPPKVRRQRAEGGSPSSAATPTKSAMSAAAAL